MRRLVALTLALTLTSGCATMASRPSEKITVTTEPSGAEASLDCGSEKSVQITPARFAIARKTPDCTLTLWKAGFEKDTAILERGVNRWTWANLPIALVGVTVLGMSGFSDDSNQSARVGGAFLVAGLGGLLVDRMTWRFHDHDPKTLHVKLRPSPQGSTAPN
jgi:hypothetical protein